VLLATALLVLGLGPFTPLAHDRAEHALLREGPQAAVDAYGDAARWGLLRRWRAGARYRAANLQARGMDEPGLAISTLRTTLRHGADDPRIEALTLALLAECLEARGRHRPAALRWEQLARLDSDPSEALLAAARAWERARRPDRALLRLAEAGLRCPEQRAEALLSMGRVGLGMGRTDKAYAWYAQALDAQPNPEQANLARLGMAMALDDMGQHEQALAELDEAHGEDRAIDIARARLQRRAAVEQGAR